MVKYSINNIIMDKYLISLIAIKTNVEFIFLFFLARQKYLWPEHVLNLLANGTNSLVFKVG